MTIDSLRETPAFQTAMNELKPLLKSFKEAEVDMSMKLGRLVDSHPEHVTGDKSATDKSITDINAKQNKLGDAVAVKITQAMEKNGIDPIAAEKIALTMKSDTYKQADTIARERLQAHDADNVISQMLPNNKSVGKSTGMLPQ